MKNKYIIICLIFLLLIIFFIQKKEYLETTSLKISDEAVQNIAKVYADSKQTAYFNNIQVKGTLMSKLTGDVSGNITGRLLSPNGKFSLDIDNSGNLSLFNGTNKVGTYILFDTTNNVVNIDGDVIIKGKDNTGDNRVRIGKNTYGDGATSTKTNVGIFAEHKTTNAIGKLQVNNFELGRKKASDTNTSGMAHDKNYDYIRSNLKNSAFNNKDNTGVLNMHWSNGYVYWTLLANNARTWNDEWGYLASSDNDS